MNKCKIWLQSMVHDIWDTSCPPLFSTIELDRLESYFQEDNILPKMVCPVVETMKRGRGRPKKETIKRKSRGLTEYNDFVKCMMHEMGSEFKGLTNNEKMEMCADMWSIIRD